MGGQVLGGGVIVLVAVLLWLVYLLPSWYQRRQYDAAERNAVRLNQALRVLAETSDTPGEVHLELNARTVLAQQRLARQAQAEREHLALEEARIELERARRERAAAQEAAQAQRAAVRADPAVRRARARRTTRLCALTLGLAGLAAVAVGAWQIAAVGSGVWIWPGSAAMLLSLLTLQRMSRVGARAVGRQFVVPAEAVAAAVQDVPLETTRREWAPRTLPRPLTASAGSRASAVLDEEAAREALRHAALEQVMREKADAQRPPSIDTARRERPAASVPSVDFAAMGVVDDAEIEAHVRRLLERRAVGA